MKKSNEHLLRAREEQTAEELREKGYKIFHGHRLGDVSVDLYATKSGQRIAFEFKFARDLKRYEAEIRKIRQRLLEKGITDFRLVVVSWPRKIDAEVDGLHEALREFIIENCNDQVYGKLPGNANVEDISDIEYDSIRVTKVGTRVKGSGTAEINEAHDGALERDGVNIPVSLPFSFDVLMNKSLKIDPDSAKVEIDTKEYWTEFAEA